MKKLSIQSISDLITNSSTEVFLFKIDDSLKEFFNDPEYSHWKRSFDIFETFDDLKKFLKENQWWDGYFTEIDGWPDSLTNFNFESFVQDMKGFRTEDEILDFFEPCFRDLIGKAVFAWETDCGDFGWKLDADIDAFNKKQTDKDKKIKKASSHYNG
jgi:hypothetical protein